MLWYEVLTLIALGFGIGGLGTVIGIGGGVYLVPTLVLLYGFEPKMAAGTSLFFVFLNVLSGSISYLRLRRVDVKLGLMFMVPTIPGAIIGAYFVGYLGSFTFRLIFAALLVWASVYLLIKPTGHSSNVDKTNKTKGYERKIVDSNGKVYAYSVNIPLGLVTGFVAGMASSIFGIGGGILHVPIMIHVLGIPVHVATATSHFILIFTTLFGSITHSTLNNISFGHAILLGLGGILGAQVGARVSGRIGDVKIKRLLGLTLLIVAIRLVLQF
ncbi:MAG: sulfite exporter TauE/SafE family protein [Nitrososphaerota archaeon]|nr:sulfite exporter TauE/SafE family protein [Aigarchaeota archaeon]MDW8076775.1 sulfite exporter TauE/SafE family protein [Nitrososphaerota archaeon]